MTPNETLNIYTNIYAYCVYTYIYIYRKRERGWTKYQGFFNVTKGALGNVLHIYQYTQLFKYVLYIV